MNLPVGIWSTERKTIKIRLEVPPILMPPPDNRQKTLSFSSCFNSSALSGIFSETNKSELCSFHILPKHWLSPSAFLALVDTYDVMESGIPNFCALISLPWPGSFLRGVERELNVPDFGKMIITASNDLNEETVDALNKQGHEVDAFGIGTNLVTCYSQAALGCVFKLVEINKQPRIKLSEDVTKVSIPCKKRTYRLFGKEVGERLLCRHPFNESKRAYVVPQRVEELLYVTGVEMQVSVSAELYDFIHNLWLNEAPVGELH
ncbi:Nicotinate phosphoribosyltransferase 1 [Raphanus sativus]|nr:Nicotinate phosphoribosyltransferase 1 [Raphanus sativus]